LTNVPHGEPKQENYEIILPRPPVAGEHFPAFKSAVKNVTE